MIVVVEADCGLGEVYGRGLVGVPWEASLPVRLDRLTPTQQGPGIQGETAMPTAAVVCGAFSLPK